MAKEYQLSMTAEEIDKTLKSASAKLSQIDFTNFNNGSFKEIVDEEEVVHSINFDENGRPIKIDDINIIWGEEEDV